MNKPITVTGLDIGSSKIAAVVARVGNDGEIDVLAHAMGSSGGVARGIVVDLNDSVNSVSSVLTKLSRKVSRKLGDMYVSINAQDIKGAKSFGMVPISLRGRELIKPDIDRSINAASTIHLPFDREIIHKIVRSFSIDDQPWIKKPLGLYASRLACEVYVITANINHIQSICKCINDAGYDVKDVVFAGIANGVSLLDNNLKSSGALLIDMGDSLTEISAFLGGSLDGFDILSLGGRDAGSDFRSSPAFNEITAAISARLSDIAKRCDGRPPSVILTGGYALVDGIIEYLEERLSCEVKIGSLQNTRGDISGLDSVRLATAIGLCGYAHEKRLSTERRPDRIIQAKVAELFNDYF